MEEEGEHIELSQPLYLLAERYGVLLRRLVSGFAALTFGIRPFYRRASSRAICFAA
jgi:hypothetical protein